ncbi:MAG: hypothetical protein Q8Q59_02185 [Luteolibacter sp.]|nr:hypothetical protein [Luteolibacter sp.]
MPWLLLTIAAAAAPEDLLRFTNGDQLRGQFLGLKKGPQAIWRHDDVSAPVEFKTTRIRHIVLHGGRALKPIGTLSHLVLVNGDRVPGTVTALDADSITLDTGYAGVLQVPRKQVSMLAPNPLGGRIYYHGPFDEDDWKMAHPSFPDGLPPSVPAGGEKEEEVESPGRWVFSGSAWYWRQKHPGTALIHKSGMPDRSVLRFEIAWKNRLNLAVGFHADFARPAADDEPGEKDKPRALAHMDSSDLPRLFGNSYVLQLYSNYLTLLRTRVDDDGKFSIQRDHRSNNSLRLGDTGQARIELRSNRVSGAVSLFVNDEFAAQWSDLDLAESNAAIDADETRFARKGQGFGFVVQGDDSPVRVSDIIVSEWNGMPDSARSLQGDENDTVLMANGTDRYAGRVGGLDPQGRILFEGKHGSFRFPLDEVAEIRFARKQQAAAPEHAADNIVIRLGPIGRISGQPVSGDGAALEILSSALGKLNLSMDPVVMIDFNASNQIINDWDADF